MAHFTSDPENFSAKERRCFFKIIHSSIIKDQKLGIPKKFVRKHGKKLSDGAILKVPSGNVWHVRLRKVDGEVWFQSGWQEFVEYHSIRAGHFLVFRYDGNSHFYVLIFDMSGNEIDYLNNSGKFAQPNYDRGYVESIKEEDEEDDSVEIVGVSHEADVDDSSAKQHSIGVRVSKRKLCTMASVTTQEQRGVIQTAGAFRSEYPFFTNIMRPAYVNHGYLPIPVRFSRRYLPKNIECVRLQTSDGRLWLVACFRKYGKKDARLGMGWTAFLRGNNIKVGDVCVFEMIEEKDTVLKVHIFPLE